MSNSSKHSNWLLTIIFIELAVIFFFVPAGRFNFETFFIPFSTGYDGYKLFPVVFITWLVWRMKNGWQPIPASPAFYPLLAFWFCCFLSSSGSTDPYQSFGEWLELSAYLLFFLMLVDLPWNERGVTIAAGGFIAGIIYMTGVGLYQLGRFSGMSWTSFRMNATYDYPNSLGVFSILSVTLLLWLFLSSKTAWQRTLLLLTALAALFCGLASQSRAAFLGYFVALLLYTAMAGRRARRIGLTMVFLFLMMASPFVFHKFGFAVQELTSQDEASRIAIWPFVMDFGLPSLSFFGMGLGPVFTEHLADTIASQQHEYALNRHWHPHNIFLYLLIGCGITGLLCFCWLLAEWYSQLLKEKNEKRILLVCGLTAFLVHQLFEVHLFLGNIPVAFFTLLATGIITARNDESIHETR